MAKKLLALALALVMVFSLAACGSPAEPNPSETPQANDTEKPADVIVLKFSDVHGPTATNHLALQAMAEEVKSQTNGAIEIEVYPSSQLGDVKASMEAVQMNTLDMAISNQAMMGSVIPEFGVVGAPFMFESDEHIKNAMNGELGDTLAEMSAKKHMNIVGYLLTGFRHVFSTKPIETPEDFKNIKIRTMENPVDVGIFNSIGAIATPMAYSELFTALQQGTVDAGENAISNFYSDKFYEVAKNLTLTGHTYNVSPIIISDSALEKIPEELKETFLKACADGIEKGRQLCMSDNEAAISKLEEAGVTIYEIDRDALKEKTLSVYEDNPDRIPAELVEMVEAAK